MHIKLYYYYIKENNINHLEIINDLAEKLVNKHINKEIVMLFNNLEF